jgi:transcriptional regulator with XRE-family HTH domain
MKRSNSTDVDPETSAAFLGRLRMLVAQCGTQASAAARAGVSVDTIGRWLQGTSAPSFIPLARLARSVDLSLDWLWSGFAPADRNTWAQDRLCTENVQQIVVNWVHDEIQAERAMGQIQETIEAHVAERIDRFLGIAKGETAPDEGRFFQALRTRLRAGALEYGDGSFSRSPSALVGELEQEALDLAGWGYVLWRRLQRAKAALSASNKAALSD